MGLTHKDVEALPAGRSMDALVATLVLGKSMENYCVARPLPFDNGDFDWTLCDRYDRPACVLPRYSTDWTAVREVVDMLPSCVLVRSADGKEWRCDSQFCQKIWSPSGHFQHTSTGDEEGKCDCRWANADTLELAVCRAALKWALDKEASS